MLTVSTYLDPMAPPARNAEPGNRSRESGTYHHGDLRQTLLDAALELLQTDGAAALTLRAVARAAGVSHTAPYRHFKDRNALVAAVADDAFERLGAAISAAVAEGPRGVAALERGLAAYVAFAHAHPAEYRVMFGPEVSTSGERAADAPAGLQVFGILREGIAALQERRLVGPGHPTLMATTAWATLHGLVMLSLDGRIAATGSSIDTLVAAASDILLSGMGAPRG